VPPELRGRVIPIGITGALVLRAVAIAAGLALIETVEAVVYAFGVLLVYVAYRAFRGAAEKSDPSANPVLRLVRRTVPITATSAVAGCSSAKAAASTARSCCSWSLRSSSPTSPSPSTRFRRPSPSPATRW
jgi:predicted tellurium resistance membrane protein TerC